MTYTYVITQSNVDVPVLGALKNPSFNGKPFMAEVRNIFGHPVFAITGTEIFEKKVMKNASDIASLESHLKEKRIIHAQDKIVDVQQPGVVNSVFSNPQLINRSAKKFDSGGNTATSYTEDPEYKELDAEYNSILAQIKDLDPRSFKVTHLQNRLDKIQLAKKRIAFGNDLKSYSGTMQSARPANVHHLRNMRFKAGGPAKTHKPNGQDIENMLESYMPEFEITLKAADVDSIANKPAKEKRYYIDFKVPTHVFKKLTDETDTTFWSNAVEHFKNYGYTQGLNFLTYDILTAGPNEVTFEVTDFL